MAAVEQAMSEALVACPTDAVLLGQRSAAYLKMNDYTRAISDAKRMVDLFPKLARGYAKEGLAHCACPIAHDLKPLRFCISLAQYNLTDQLTHLQTHSLLTAGLLVHHLHPLLICWP